MTPSTVTKVIAPPSRLYRVGTLAYTRAGLVTLFSWLLWGDFVYTLMEAVLPSMLPILLKQHGANNREIAVIGTIYMVANMIMNPIISYRSDRFRSRWGRRRPFIIVTTPFVVLFLSAIPFAPEILEWVQGVPGVVSLFALAPVAPIILMFGLLVACFQIFNMFIASVYYYLIPDVVPADHLGRFYGLFRVFGTLAGVLFGYFAFGYAETHMKEIFFGNAIVYGVFITLMCWRVKEGEYPPVPPDDRRGHWWSGIQRYVLECFGHRYYWWVFLAYSCWVWAMASNVFGVFFYRDEVGISLDSFGKMSAMAGTVFMVLAFPCGVLIDRLGCHKTLVGSLLFFIVTCLGTFFFVHGPVGAFVWMIARTTALTLTAMVYLKWTVEVYPRDRYGMFSSAGAMLSSLGGILFSPLAGWLMDSVNSYRCFLMWNVGFALLAVVAALVVYNKWTQLGGPKNYQAP